MLLTWRLCLIGYSAVTSVRSSYHQGNWDVHTAGGAIGQANFYTNPQYEIHISESTQVHIQLEAPKDYSVNTTLVSSDGTRQDTVAIANEVLNSGAYRPGFAYCSSREPIKAGTYTLIASTFKADQIGSFTLTVSSSSALLECKEIPVEGLGMACQRIKGSWSLGRGTAVGCSNHG